MSDIKRHDWVMEVTRDLLPIEIEKSTAWETLTEEQKNAIMRDAKELLKNEFFNWFSKYLVYVAGEKIIRTSKTDGEVTRQRGAISYVESISKRANELLQNNQIVKGKTKEKECDIMNTNSRAATRGTVLSPS